MESEERSWKRKGCLPNNPLPRPGMSFDYASIMVSTESAGLHRAYKARNRIEEVSYLFINEKYFLFFF